MLVTAGMLVPASAETVLRIRMPGDLKQIDPLWTSSYPVRDMAYLIYDTLFAMDAKFNPRPQMVDKYDISADGTVYSFTLRDHLKWHDGKPVTSADCIASLERWMTKDGLGRELARQLDRFEATDARSFKIVLKRPWGLTLTALAKVSSYVPFMMPERLAKTPPDKDITEPIGSGPFKMKVDEWNPGSKIVYVKNPDYVPRNEPASGLAGGKSAKVDRIERIHIPDDTSAVNALIAGEIDYIDDLAADMTPLVEASPDLLRQVRDPLGRGTQVVLNHTQPPFDNIKVRQAVQWALSQKEFMQALFGKRTERFRLCPSMYLCGGPYESDANSERVMGLDVDKAKALLKEAGYDGTPIVVLHPTDQKLQDDWCTVLVQSLRRVGFTVDDQVIDLATMFSRRASRKPAKEGGWHAFVTGWGGVDLMNPATNVFLTGACDKAWYGWPCDKELQDLSAAFFTAPDEASRKAIATKLQIRSMDVVTYVPMGQDYMLAVWNKKVNGIGPSPVPIFWNVSKAN